MGICKCVCKHTPLGELKCYFGNNILYPNLLVLYLWIVYGVRISPIYIKASSWPDLPKTFPGGNLVGSKERKDIHLSLSPELLSKAHCLLTSGRCLSLHQPRKFCYSRLTAYSRRRNIWSTQASVGWGNYVCAASSRPSCSFFLPFLTLMCRHRQTAWWGHAVASPRCVRSSAYLESICWLPSTDLKQLAFQQLPCLCPLCTVKREEKGRERRVWEMVRGRRKKGRYYNAPIG